MRFSFKIFVILLLAASFVAPSAHAIHDESGETTVASGTGGLAVPAAWSASPDSWVEQVTNIKAALADVPPPMWETQVVAMQDKENDSYLGFFLGATTEEVIAWLGQV